MNAELPFAATNRTCSLSPYARRVTAQGNYSELDAANLIQQIIDGVVYLHKKGAHWSLPGTLHRFCILLTIPVKLLAAPSALLLHCRHCAPGSQAGEHFAAE